MHLHALWQSGLAEVQLCLLADAFLSFLLLLLHHLVEDQHRTSSRDGIRFEVGLPQVVRQILLGVSLLLQLISLIEGEGSLVLLGDN